MSDRGSGGHAYAGRFTKSGKTARFTQCETGGKFTQCETGDTCKATAGADAQDGPRVPGRGDGSATFAAGRPLLERQLLEPPLLGHGACGVEAAPSESTFGENRLSGGCRCGGAASVEALLRDCGSACFFFFFFITLKPRVE